MKVNNRLLAAAFGVLLVGWFTLRHTLGFYNGLPAFILWFDFSIYLFVLIFTPALIWKARWTALGAFVVGVILDVAYAGAILAMSVTLGRWTSLVLGLFFTYFSFRAFREK